MSSLIEQIRTHIQDPGQTTTMSQYSPRRQALFPPTTLSVVEATEIELAFKLPTLLSQLYTQVANGGFGPGYGILGLDGGYAEPLPVPPDSVDQTKRGILTDWYFSFHDIGQPKLDFYMMSDGNSTLFIDPEPNQGTWNWYDELLPISNHGCWQFSCVDCSKSSFPVYYFDGQQCQLKPASRTFEDWMRSWLHSTY